MALSNNKNAIEKVKTFCVPVFVIAGILSIVINTAFDSSIKLFESFTGNMDMLNEYKNTDNTLYLSKYLASLCSYQYFVYHSGIVWFGLYLIITKQVKFGLKEWIRNSVILYALLIVAIWVNSFLIQYGTNFMFVVAPPAKGIPLLNLDHGWYVYMIHYMFVGAFVTFMFQLPWIIKERKIAKQ